MPGRKFTATSSYRYGFNGQEKSDEIDANFTTAQYWEYDSRTGRRWNIDPKPIDGLSDYACFANNPILNIDVNGDVVTPTPSGQWYRKGKGGNLSYRYFLDQNKNTGERSGYELIPEGSRDRVIFGKTGNSSITLNADGTFHVVDSKGKVTDGKSEWNIHLASGGYFDLKGKNYYINQAVGPDGALVGAAEWLAGEKVASVVGTKILAPIFVKVTSKVITEVAVKEISVIGPRVTYRKFAEKMGAHFLNVTDDAWTWRMNKNFLREVVKRGDDVIFAGKFDPLELAKNPNSILAREIEFLTERGYSWTKDFSKLVK